MESHWERHGPKVNQNISWNDIDKLLNTVSISIFPTQKQQDDSLERTEESKFIVFLLLVKRHCVPSHVMSQASEKWKSLFFRDPLESDEINMERLKNQGCGNPFGGKPHLWPRYFGQTFTIHKANSLVTDNSTDEESIIPNSYQDFKTSLNGRTKIRLVRKQLNHYLATHPQIPTIGRVLVVPSASMTFSQIKNSDLHYWKQRSDRITQLSTQVHRPITDILFQDSSADRNFSKDTGINHMEIGTEPLKNSFKEKENQHLEKIVRKRQKLDLPYTSIRTRLMRHLNRRGN